MRRVRRQPPAPTVESAQVRVRRSRPAPEAVQGSKAVIKEGPGVPARRGRRPTTAPGSLPLFLVDWSRPLSWKFSIYMVTSYLYYRLNRSLITDHDFDRLCKELDAGYRTFRHPHKHLVDRGQLAAATGYDIEYPMMVIGAATHMAENFAER